MTNSKNANLTDNPNVTVDYFKQFLPKDRVEISFTATDNNQYQGSFIFYHDARHRMASVGIYKTCIDVRIYFVHDYPKGCLQNIDWNDSQYIEITKNASKIRPFELFCILDKWGYEHRGTYGFDQLKLHQVDLSPASKLQLSLFQ